MLTHGRAQREEQAPRPGLAEALGRPRFEVLPLPGVEDEVAEHAPHATVTITSSPRRGQAATLQLARRLRARGVTVVPHLSARTIVDEAHLRDVLDELVDLRIHEVFVVGGDREQPAGAFAGSLDLLVAIERLGYGFVVGIAGYPETHPRIPDDVAVQAMSDKRRFASYIVSQMCFDPAVIVRWADGVRRRGIDLPIYVGLPGPTSLLRLLRVSSRIGVGESARVLAQHGAGMLRLVQPGVWRPDALLQGLAEDFDGSVPRLQGLHVYTFNDVAAAERWRESTSARMRAGGGGRS